VPDLLQAPLVDDGELVCHLHGFVLSWVTNSVVTEICSWRSRSHERSSSRTWASRARTAHRGAGPWLDGQRPGQGHPLALAAGELRRVALGEMLDVHQLEQLVHPPADLGLGRRRTSRPNATLRRTLRWRNGGVVLEAEPNARSRAGGR